MAWPHEVAAFAQDKVTPHEFMAEIDASMREFNGHLDRDSFSETLPGTKFAVDTFNTIDLYETAGPTGVVKGYAQSGAQWQFLASASITVTTDDCMLSILAGCTTDSGVINRLGVFVDGVLVAATPADERDYHSHHLSPAVPVGAGSHTVRLGVQITSGTAGTFNFQQQQLLVRQERR